MKFKSGQIVATTGIVEETKRNPHFSESIKESLKKHLSGDWGCVSVQDSELNDQAIANKDRIFSTYEIFKKKIYIITEADRSATTVLFPDEY